jgi:hypothetical protein
MPGCRISMRSFDAAKADLAVACAGARHLAISKTTGGVVGSDQLTMWRRFSPWRRTPSAVRSRRPRSGDASDVWQCRWRRSFRRQAGDGGMRADAARYPVNDASICCWCDVTIRPSAPARSRNRAGPWMQTFRAVPERGRNLEAVPMTIYALVTGSLWKAISAIHETLNPPPVEPRRRCGEASRARPACGASGRSTRQASASALQGSPRPPCRCLSEIGHFGGL